jgi:hypothetical protein
MLRVELTNATTITFDRGDGTDDMTEIVWQAVELKDASTVQRGSVSFATGVDTATAMLSPAVNIKRAVAFGSVQSGAGQNMGRSPYTGNDITGVGSVTARLGIGFRGAASASAGSGVLTLTISKPAGTRVDDLMVASIGVRPDTAVITPPSGWTLVRRTNNANPNANSLATYWKAAGATEPANYAWTFDTSTGSAGGILAFSGVEQSNPINIENGQNTANGLTHAAPSVTTTVADTMIVTSHSFSSSETWTPPTSMTEVVDVASQVVPNAGGRRPK